MFTAETLAAEVLEAAENDIDRALAALCDGEYLGQLFPQTCGIEEEELVENAYAILKAMK
jgi:hypothetical protein